MRAATATAPARAERPNEDFVVFSNTVAVLLDGSGNPRGAAEGCHHGVAWFARTLGTSLLNGTADHPHSSLTDALRSAIENVADLHRATCDLDHPGSPSATVVAVRQRSEHLDYLVLADSVLLLHNDRETKAITDDREATVGRDFRHVMDNFPSGSREHDRAHRRYVETLRGYRNRPGGFWVASSDPRAADEALTGTVATRDITAAVLLSDGASRLVDRFNLATWPQLVKLVADEGPDALIDRVRAIEHSDPDGRRWPRGKVTDDATVAFLAPISDDM